MQLRVSFKQLLKAAAMSPSTAAVVQVTVVDLEGG